MFNYKQSNDGQINGAFQEKSYGNYFSYCQNSDTHWLDQKEYPHKIHTIDGFRYARVLKTVAHVVVDENEYGEPVVEKWEITNHRKY